MKNNPEHIRRHGVLTAGQQIEKYARQITAARWNGSVDLVALRCTVPETEEDDYLCVLTGFDAEGTPVVAFNAAGSLEEAIAGGLKRMALGKLRWKVDEYALKRLRASGS